MDIVWVTRKMRVLMLEENTAVILCLAESLSVNVCLGWDDMENHMLAFLSPEYIAQKDAPNSAPCLSEVRSLWTCHISHVLSIRVHRPCCVTDFIFYKWTCFICERKGNRYVVNFLEVIGKEKCHVNDSSVKMYFKTLMSYILVLVQFI